jgi:hypothetical protein
LRQNKASAITVLAAPQYLRHTYAPSVPLDGRHGLSGITFSAGVLAEIRRFAVEEHAEEREAAGVLLGQRVDSVLQVTSFQPVWRSEFGAKHFALNEAEERQLRKQVAKWKAGRGGGIEAVGWFRAYGRGETYLDLADFELHSRIFASSWALAMCVRPAHHKQSQASLYMQDARGEWRAREPLARVPLAGESGGAANWMTRRPEVRLVRGFRAAAREFMPLRQWVLCALAMFVAAASLIGYLQMRKRSAADALALEARLEARRLHLRWDPKAAGAARHSAFLMVAGERRNLDEAEFVRGHVEIPLAEGESRDLEIRLQAGAAEDSTHIVQGPR